MKTAFLLFMILLPCSSYSQQPEVTAERESSMREAAGRYVDGRWTYFQIGEKESFTGIICVL